MQVNNYLLFDGGCEQAFQFYSKVFGKDISMLSRYSDMPESDNLSAEQKTKIMHIALPLTNHFILMGADIAQQDFKLVTGNASSISLNFDKTSSSKDEVHHLFNALAEDGKIIMPFEESFWGAIFGACIDKFGHHWMINYNLS